MHSTARATDQSKLDLERDLQGRPGPVHIWEADSLAVAAKSSC